VYTSDGPTLDDEHPEIVFGVRGVLSVELRVSGAKADLHSGNWGSIAPNAAWKLVHLLGTMLNENNEITIDGFSDDVRPLTPLMAETIARIPLDQQAALATIGIETLPPPVGVGYFERIVSRPTLTINGLTSGYQGPRSKTVLPSRASAKLDMRLVADQRADDVYEKFVRHVKRHAPDVEIVRQGSMEPSATPLDHPLADVIRRAVERGFGTKPVEIPALG